MQGSVAGVSTRCVQGQVLVGKAENSDLVVDVSTRCVQGQVLVGKAENSDRVADVPG